MTFSLLLVALAGFFAGNIVLAVLWHWIRAALDVHRTGDPGHRWRRVALTSLFNAGPWMLVAAGIFVYYVRDESWAPWFFAGAIAWIAFMAFMVATVWRRVWIDHSVRRGK